MRTQLPTSEGGQEYIRCVQCKTRLTEQIFVVYNNCITFKRCVLCIIQNIESHEYKQVGKAKQRDKTKEYHNSIKGKEALNT